MLERAVSYVVAHHWGDIASVVGLPLTLAGLAVTYLAARRARRSADAAARDVADLKQTIARIDAVEELSGAIEMLEEIKRLHRHSDPTALLILPERYAAACRRLSAIKADQALLSEQHRAAVVETIAHLRRLEAQADKALVRGSLAQDVPRLNVAVTRRIERLHTILTDVRGKIGA